MMIDFKKFQDDIREHASKATSGDRKKKKKKMDREARQELRDNIAKARAKLRKQIEESEGEDAQEIARATLIKLAKLSSAGN